MNKTIYIAGKITGDKDYRAKFCLADVRLRIEGYKVLNPALLPDGLERRQYMDICFAMIRQSDAVYFLKDWKESEGAKIEHALAEYEEREIIYEEDEGK